MTLGVCQKERKMGSVYQCGGANIGIAPSAPRSNRAGVWRAASQFSPDLRATGRG